MRQFGLIGKTLGHSFSKNYFARKFEKENISDCIYENFELDSVEELRFLLKKMPFLEGLNVTIPYKEKVISLLDEQHDAVKEIGACNCISIRNGDLYGYNTDAAAFTVTLESCLQSHHRCALVLGTGGASKAVGFALKQLQMDFLVVSRNKEGVQIGYEDLGEEMIKGHQVIINTTPLGMYPNVDEDPPIPYEYINGNHLLYDLVYNPEKTKFLRNGEERGAKIMNGYSMLVHQAEESWKIWNGSAI
jgi:shikimate dehydrogenase